MSAAVQEAWAQLAIQRRRARWFEYVRRRFDMVALSMVADWCAREPGGVVRNEGAREQAYQDLYQSILEGEFGPGEWPAVAHMPTPVPTYSPFYLRRGLFHIQSFWREGYNPLVDLWAPRPAVVEWFTRRGIGLPPALRLAAPIPPPATPAAAVTRPPADPLPPFNAYAAKALLVGMKAGKQYPHRPTESKVNEIILSNFSTTSRDGVREIIKDVWKDKVNRGPRPAKPAKQRGCNPQKT